VRAISALLDHLSRPLHRHARSRWVVLLLDVALASVAAALIYMVSTVKLARWI
jgi:hypothetical protein